MKKMIDINEALELVINHTPRLSVESIALKQALGRVLAEPLRADRDYPPFDRVMMDGLAVKIADAGKTVKLAGVVPAGLASDLCVEAGHALEVMTGSLLPPGAEAVIKIEDVHREGDIARLPAAIQAGQHIARSGNECRVNHIIADAGETITPLLLANLATFGYAEVSVARKPRLAIIVTGDELVTEPGAKVCGPLIRDGNSPMLEALAQLAGAEVISRSHARDTEADLQRCLELGQEADLIIFSGGVSAGKFDLVPKIIADLGAQIIFHKIMQQPGKPLLFAVRDRQLIFGLPGTPLGSHLGFHRYVREAINRLLNKRENHSLLLGQLNKSVRIANERFQFILAHAQINDGRWLINPLPASGSSDIFGPALANCYLHLSGGQREIAAGELVDFELFGVR